MYCNFFGFSETPFDVTPDPKFLYLSPGHREMLAALVYGIRYRRGFITIVGEVGTGKTTLLNTVLGQLDEKAKVAYIFNTDATFEQMLTMALLDLGLARSDETVSKVEAIQRLNDFAIRQLASGGNVILIVDEAQNLDGGSMENLRLLSNLETPKQKLIQIILSGQPELDIKLSRPELRQLAQRISLRRYIKPLSEKETYEYIQHRLSVANYTGPSLFSRRARRIIWEYSEGVPRKINILCDNALLVGYAIGGKTIEASVVEEAIRDLSWSPFSEAVERQAKTPTEEPPIQLKAKVSGPQFALAASLILVACVILVTWLLSGDSPLHLKSSGPTASQTATAVESPSQPDSPDQSAAVDHPVSHNPLPIAKEVTVTSAPQEEVESKPQTFDEQPHSDRAIADATMETENHKPDVIPEGAQSETEESQIRKEQMVVVKRGDSLSRIIIRAYGSYNGTTLSTVLQENPEIENPDLILVGQSIELPKE
jgi:general secretion pathway protein A